MVPVLFPGIPGGVELLVILLIMLLLLGLPLLLLVVGGFGFWTLSQGDDGPDDETVEELRRRVDELESRLADDTPGDAGSPARDGADEDTGEDTELPSDARENDRPG